MIKPYLYGGIVLLIVGLFLFALYQHQELKVATLELEASTQALEALNATVVKMKEARDRQTGALEAYMEKDAKNSALLTKATKIIADYTKRDTPNEKCLDLVPPADLIRMLDSNSISGQGDLHSSKQVSVDSSTTP